MLDVDGIDVSDVRRGYVDVRIIGRCDSSLARKLRWAATTTNAGRLGGRWRGWRSSSRGGRRRPATPPRRRCGLFLRTDALLTLPARADSRDLVVGEQSEMAANGHVHLTKNRDDFVAGNPELACHVVYAKLAQTILLADSTRVRSLPLDGGRLDESTNASREL